MTVVKQLEKYLNKAVEINDDYLVTLSYTESSEAILYIPNEKLKKIAAMIYLCSDFLRFVSYEITYNAGGFEVNIINPETPF
jgi:hypothetical protein